MNDDAKTEIEQLIQAWAGAVRAKQIEGVVAHHADDMVMFDDSPRLRLTLGLRREDGRWQIAHEHHSFPLASSE